MATRRFPSAHLLFSFFLLTAFSKIAQGQGVLIRKPGETPTRFAQRLLPPHTMLVYPVREVALGPFRHALVVLFGETPDKGSGSYDDGWVLAPVPGTRGQYRKHSVPALDNIDMSAVAAPIFWVKSAFSVPLHRGAEPSLLILFSARGPGAVRDDRTRSRDEQEYVVEACRWTGLGLVFDPVGDRLAGLSTEKAIRRRLLALR